MPRYNLKRPCKNCPFRSDDTRIRFSCRERAEEIENSAYRNGFPCHLSADLQEDDRYGEPEGSWTPWPGIDNDEDLLTRLAGQIDLNAPVFDDVDAFLKANE